MEADGGGRRVDAQLGAERLRAREVLAKGEVGLALAAVAANQTAMGVLTAGVPLDDALAEAGARRVPALAEVQTAEPVEEVEVGEAQALTGQHRPLLVRVVGQEVALIQGGREFVLRHGPGRLAGRLEPSATLHMALELVHVDPQPEVGREAVGAALQHDDRHVSGAAQRASEAVNGDVEAVPTRLW
jgi:hypothetical protein